MKRTFRTIVVALVVAATLLAATPASSDPDDSVTGLVEAHEDATGSARAAPSGRVLAANPWSVTDPLGDSATVFGDLRSVMVNNSRQQVQFTWRMRRAPKWDNLSNDLLTGMVFRIDWQGTTLPPNRLLIVVKEDNVWNAVIANGTGQAVCSRQGGVIILPNHGFRITAPVQQCLGGPKVLRVSGGFVEDQDPGPGNDPEVDIAPNGRAYGPFIRLPARSRAEGRVGGGGAGGWTVH